MLILPISAAPRLRPHYLPTVSGSKDKSRLVQPYILIFHADSPSSFGIYAVDFQRLDVDVDDSPFSVCLSEALFEEDGVSVGVG